MTATVDPVAAFVAAVRAGDTARARDLLGLHPTLRQRIDDSLPGFDFDGTALIAAVEGGNLELVDLLLDAGADIDQRSRWWAGGFGVLDRDDSPLIHHLVARGATVDAYAAARHGWMDRLRTLVAADPTAACIPRGDGQTPLHVAASVEVADYLLAHGAAIDALDVDHESTPAQYLVRRRPEVVRHLVARGCRTDILLAAAVGDVALVRHHLDADPRSLRTAVSPKWFPMRNRRAGGHIYIWTLGQNKTAHVVAHERGHHDVFKLLMEASPDELRLVVACVLADEALATTLLARRPDLIATLSDADKGQLVAAAMDDDLAAVRLMLQVGWPTTVRGSEDGTALHWAAFHGNAAMATVLLASGAAVDARERTFGQAPLGWAIHGSLHGWHCRTGDYAAVVSALLAAGAEPPADVTSVKASEPVLDVLRRTAEG